MVEGKAAVAWLLAAAVLAAPASALAREHDRARPVRDAYPLPERAAAPTDAGAATEMAAAPSYGAERLVLASILALIAGGLTTRLVSMRWPPARAVSMAAAVPDAAPVRSTAPELWLHGAAEPAPPRERPPVASPPLPLRPPGTPAPPQPDRAWAAEIGWHLVGDAAQFRVTARLVDGAAEPVTLRASPLLEWPPAGARSVQALTDAVKTLESTLVAAGWTPLPRGSAWYAKRFTWQPGARPRPSSATAGRTRHRKLYEDEYAQQIDRTRRLRATIGARLDRGADSNGTAPQ